jgi:D-alanine-D-alanine ligase
VKVAVLFDDVASRPDATLDELGVLEAVSAVEVALRQLGYDVEQVPAGEAVETWQELLRKMGAGLVFNLCEGLGGRSDGEIAAARAVETLGLPMTGSPWQTLTLARRKDRVNALLPECGVPVPAWGVWPRNGGQEGGREEAFAEEWRVYPAIVKPVSEDGSVGIDEGAVVADAASLARRLQSRRAGEGLLVQAFVGSRELNAAIVGNEVLPISEIVFRDLPEGHPPIVGYRAKWVAGSPEDEGTRPICPAPLPLALAARVRLLALKAWKAVGGRGYGRVDFRLTLPDLLHVLEVNPNPDLGPAAGLARAAEAGELSYRDLVKRIVREAVP